MWHYLERRRDQDVTYVPALGYQMIADTLPARKQLLCRSRTWGAPFLEMNKLSLFNPDAVEKTSFMHGRHCAEPAGRLRLPERDELLLLHYKYVGLERCHRRAQLLRTGLGATDLANG